MAVLRLDTENQNVLKLITKTMFNNLVTIYLAILIVLKPAKFHLQKKN